MLKKKLAKSTEEFDRRFDDGEDIHDLIDISKAKIVRHGRKVRITIDIPEELASEIDGIRAATGEENSFDKPDKNNRGNRFECRPAFIPCHFAAYRVLLFSIMALRIAVRMRLGGHIYG